MGEGKDLDEDDGQPAAGVRQHDEHEALGQHHVFKNLPIKKNKA